MSKNITIEYCTSWGYVARAVALTENLLKENKNTLAMVSLIPSTGGVFEVKLNDKMIFSKKELNRYPKENEIEEIITGKK